MSKKNRLLVGDLKELYKDAPQYDMEYMGYTIKYKPFLTMNEKIAFIGKVMGWCINDNKEYLPLMFDFGVRCETLKYYTNITIPSGQREATNLVCGSGLYEALMQKINYADYQSLIQATKEEIEMTTAKNPLEGVIDYIESILAKYDKEFSAVDVNELFKLLQVVTQMNDKKEMVNILKGMYRQE